MKSSCLQDLGWRLGAVVLSGALATGCEPPPVVATADVRQQQTLSRIEGELVVQGMVRGNAIVLLYDAERPPPPQGTGRPVSFTVVPRERLFGPASATATGPFTAPYAFSLVAPGHYLVRGFIDAEASLTGGPRAPDFIPWYTVTGEPDEGDVGGAAVDAQRQPRVVEVMPDSNGVLPAATQVNVSFSDTLGRVPFDRPTFWVDSPSRFEGPTGVKLLTLKPQTIGGLVDQRAATFFVRLADENGDGQPEDANKDNVLDFWPRVVVRKLVSGAAPGTKAALADENDLDGNGILDETGEDYEQRQSGARDGLPDLVLLNAAIDLSPDLFKKSNGAWNFDPIPLMSLTVKVQPQALDARDRQKPVLLKNVPSGRYALTLIQFTGQTWRVPNELSLEPSREVPPERQLPWVPNQSFVLEVP
jgi:hypothetical protein